jgi:hypothetical protein
MNEKKQALWRISSMIVAVGSLATACAGGDGGLENEPTQAVTAAVARPGNGRPASVPDDYVVTPGGYFHPSCVIEVGDGERITGLGQIERSDGRRRSFSKCQHPRFDKRGAELRESDAASKLAAEPQTSGWISSAQNSSQGPVRSLTADFKVPPAPSNPAGQVVYFFPGLEPASTGNTIMQPVLGWNHAGDGQQRWTMASWNCCQEGNIVHSNHVPVNVGDMLHGEMLGTNCGGDGVCANWSVKTFDNDTTEFTFLDTTSYGQVMDWLFGGALEVYFVDQCAQLPVGNGIKFWNITTAVAAGQVSYPWFPAVGGGFDPDCSYGLTSTNDSVTLTWTNPNTPLTTLPRTGWVASASSTAGADVPARALDGNTSTRFSTGVPQSNAATQTFTVDMLSTRSFSRVVLDSPGSDYARNYQVYVSDTPSGWGVPVASGTATTSVTTVDFAPVSARYLQVRALPAAGVGSWWSIRELNVLGAAEAPPPSTALSRSGWVATASATSGTDVASRALDGNTATRWASGSAQSNGATRTFTVDMLSPRTFARVTLDSAGDYARNYQVFASTDGINWGQPIAVGTGTGTLTSIGFNPKTARYLQIRQTNAAGIGSWWSLRELNVYSP